MKMISRSDFDIIVSKGVVVVDFYAKECASCRKLASQIALAAMEMQGSGVDMIRVNIHDDFELAHDYGIKDVPTTLILKDGKTMKQLQGYFPKEILVNELEVALNQI